ncbi:MAG: lysylphosphatidylglycerol synthase domain-containing protein, partial [bacterium]
MARIEPPHPRAAANPSLRTPDACPPGRARPPARRGGPGQAGPLPGHWLRRGLLLFLLLTVSAQVILLARSGTASWRDTLLIPHPLFLIFALLSTVGEALLAGARLAVFNNILPRRVSFLTCVRANLCAVFAMTLTPGGVGGGPMQMFGLTRAGMPLGDAAMLSVASFFTTLLALAAGGAAAAVLGSTAALEHSPALAGLFRATGLFCLLAGGALITLLWKPDLPPALLYRLFRLLPDRGGGPGPTRPFRQAIRALVAARKTAGRYLRHGRGAVQNTFVCLRDTDADNAVVGAPVIISPDHLPNAQLGQ